MYTLRTITDNNIQQNESIGDKYSWVDKLSNYTEFQKLFLEAFNENHVADLDPTSTTLTKECEGFLLYKGEILPLFSKNRYYIMTESGKTFSNLSYNK